MTNTIMREKTLRKDICSYEKENKRGTGEFRTQSK